MVYQRLKKVNNMKTFKEYYEDKETEEIFSEGVVTKIIGHILGFSTAGVLTAWAAALLFKGGVGAINNFAKTLGKNEITFKKNFKEATKESQSVKNELSEMEILRKKYENELSEVLSAIRIKDWEKASTAFKELPQDKQNSTEIKRVVIEEVVKVTKCIVIDTPTPGSESYQAIRKITDMQTAKAVAKVMQEQVHKYITSEEK